MSRLGRVVLGLALATLTLLAGTTAGAMAASASGTVVRVLDGDTVQVRTAARVRTIGLLGVDAPELRGGDTCHGAAAKRALARLLPKGAAVRLVTDAGGPRSGRYVYRANTLVNVALLKAGNAHAASEGLKLASRLEAAENAAEQDRRGLWDRCAPPPSSSPAPSAGPAPGPDPLTRARGDLAGRVFIRLTTTTFSSSESRLHLCPDGRYIEDVSTFSDLSGSFTARTEGAWQVLSANYTAAVATARVRLRNPDGTEGFSDFFAQGGAVAVNGSPVSVNRSDLCP